MKKIINWIFLSVFSLLNLCINDNFADEIIHIANGEWPPYQSEQLKNFGFISQITSEAFASEGIKVKYTFFPWKRAYEQVKKGNIDGAIFWIWNEDRDKIFYFSDLLVEVKYVF